MIHHSAGLVEIAAKPILFQAAEWVQFPGSVCRALAIIVKFQP